MKKEAKIQVGKIILGTVATAGIISMAVLAPNAVQCLEMFWGKDKRKYSSKYYVKNTITKLKERGLIKFQNEDGKTFVRLTEKGSQRLLKYQLREFKIKKPKKWDGKWRIIVFDIKETKKKIRNSFRSELVNLGFIRLQNSVWVHPYDCEEVIVLLKANFYTGKDILYITADRVENDKWLKKEFGLM